MSSQSFDELLDCTDDDPVYHPDPESEFHLEKNSDTPIDTFELIDRCKLIVDNLRNYAMMHGLNMLTSDDAANNLSKLLE